MTMAGWIKSELASVIILVCLLDAVSCTRPSKDWICKEKIINRFEQMNPSKVNLYISKMDFPSTRLFEYIGCNAIHSSDIQQFNTHIVNAVIDCEEQNLNIADTLIYGNFKSGLPPHDIILDKPFFNILLISNSTSGIPADQKWVDARKNIYSLRIALLGFDDRNNDSSNATTLFEQVSCSGNTTRKLDSHKRPSLDFQGRRLVVGVVLYTPFVVRERESRESPYIYHGYCIEILKALSQSLNFTYKIRKESTFGVEGADGQWTGAIGELTRKKIDMMLTGMSIIAQRAKVLDFTYPFWEETTGILMRTKLRSSFVIARPLKASVWFAFVGAIVIASLFTFFFEIAAVTIHSSRRKRKRFSFWTILWHSVGVALWQSSDGQPATRTAGGILLSFRFVSTIILVTYSANLVSNLTLKEVDVPFETLKDVANDPDHALFINGGGAHRTLLEDAKPTSIYGKLWKKAYLLTGSSTKGVEMVLLDNYTGVVMTDKTSLTVKAVRSEKCNWALLKEEFFKTNFGIGLPKHSPFNKFFSVKIQEYQSRGLLKKWEKRHIQPWSDTCKTENIYSESTSMKIADMWPVFSVLAAGAVVALVVFSIEYLIDKVCCVTY